MQEYTILVIIALIVITVLIFNNINLKDKMAESSIRSIRRENIRKSADAHIVSVPLLNQNKNQEIYFPIIKMDIKKGEELKMLSKAMVADWTDLLQGKRELFDTREEKTVYCIVGHHIKFKEKNKKIPLKDLAEYQRKHTIWEIGEKIYGVGNTTISEYLAGYSTKNIFEEEKKQLEKEFKTENIIPEDDFFNKKINENRNTPYIDTNKDYITITVYTKKGYWVRWLKSLLGTQMGLAVGGFLGVVLVPFTGGGSLVIIGTAIAGATIGGIYGYHTGSEKSADWDASIFLLPNDEKILKELKCNELPTIGRKND